MKKKLSDAKSRAKREIERDNVKQIIMEVAGLIGDCYPGSSPEITIMLSKKILRKIREMCYVDYGHASRMLHRIPHQKKKV